MAETNESSLRIIFVEKTNVMGHVRRRRFSSSSSSIAVVAALFSAFQFLFVHWYCFPDVDMGDVLHNNSPSTAAASLSPATAETTVTSRILRKGTLQSSGRAPDAYFNTVPLYLQRSTGRLRSGTHCVGNTPFEETSWMYRSCHYTYLCLDPTTHDFFVVDGDSAQPQPRQPNDARIHSSTDLYQRPKDGGDGVSSSSITASVANFSAPAVALGGINPRWNGTSFNQGVDKVRWAPQVVRQLPPSYYELDDNVVLVPFHSFAGHNVGHLLWDDFLPIFTLLQTFGLLEEYHEHLQPLLLRVDTLPTLFASCDIRRNKRAGCQANFDKFLPLMSVDPETFSTVREIKLDGHGQSLLQREQATGVPICAKHAAAGLGMLTDHGRSDHGWEPLPTDSVHNIGRGPQLYQFRNFMLRNMGLSVHPMPPLTRRSQFHILLNAHSSRDRERDKGMEEQLKALEAAFPSVMVSVLNLKGESLPDQIGLVSQRTNIFVSTCGGGSMSAFFLPRGSSLILYYADQSGFNFDRFALTGGPAMLDWDLFNNAAYLRVHWLPISGMNSPDGLQALVSLIQREMDVALNS